MAPHGARDLELLLAARGQSSSPTARQRIISHLTSIGIVASFAGLQKLLWPVIDPAPFLLFYPAVILCALIGDGTVGLLLSAVAVQALFAEADSTLLQDGFRMAIFLVSAFAIVRVVKALRQARGGLEEQMRFFDRALAASPDFIYVLDASGRFLFANRPLLSFWGRTLDEVVGRTIRELGYPEDLVLMQEEQIREVLRTRRAVRGENTDSDPRGGQRCYEFVFAPSFSASGSIEFVTGVTRDITERKRSEARLEEAVQAREEVLGIVSHDLRNPLGSILMNVALLKRKASSAAESASLSLLERVERAGRRMNEMIEDLLCLARIEAGTFAVARREACGCDIVSEAVDMAKPFADEKGIRIEISGIEEALQIPCDYRQVLRVFSNLIGNAVKFTPEQGLIRVSAKDLGPEVLFSVSDTGPGIAEHHLPQIFDRFWQAKKSTGSGAGLGLMISRGIVEAHGGKIWAESQFGSGATFYFTLPKAAQGRAAA